MTDDRFTPSQRFGIKLAVFSLLATAELGFCLLNMFMVRAMLGPEWIVPNKLFGVVGFLMGFRLLGPIPRGHTQTMQQRLQYTAIRGTAAFIAAAIVNRLST